MFKTKKTKRNDQCPFRLYIYSEIILLSLSLHSTFDEVENKYIPHS